jgi:hypothetical protein
MKTANQTSDYARRFVSEPITPVVATSDTARMTIGEPGLPRELTWRVRTIEILTVLRSWRATGKCRNGRPELYVRKHWYEVVSASNETMTIYFSTDSPAQVRQWVSDLKEEGNEPGGAFRIRVIVGKLFAQEGFFARDPKRKRRHNAETKGDACD